MVVLKRFFLFGRQEKWSLVALDRWSSYTVTIIWGFAWAYRGGRLNRFDCIIMIIKLLHWFKCRDLTEEIHLFYINNWLNEWYAHGSQDLIWKFSQVVSDFKNNQKVIKGSKIIFILMNVTTKLIQRHKFNFQIQHKQIR